MNLKVDQSMEYQQAGIDWEVAPEFRLRIGKDGLPDGGIAVYGLEKKHNPTDLRGQEYGLVVIFDSASALAVKLRELADKAEGKTV